MEGWREIRDQLLAVLRQLDDRLPSDQIELIQELIDAGEGIVALEQIADVLSEDEIGLRDDERAHLIALSGRLGAGERVTGALSLCPPIS